MDGEVNSGERPHSDYQVFLSFRGFDTRTGITDSLYHFLVDAGVRVFLDNEELRPGDKTREILAAINGSLICIPILSEHYANSRWCLLELAEMVKLKKAIMPILYKVEADDVKLKTDRYKDQLSKFGSKYDAEKLEWEDALLEVARIKALNIRDFSGDGALSKEVAKQVLRRLEAKHAAVEDRLIGIDDHVEAVMKKIDVRSPDVRFVVIHGIGGVGKTSLAKFIFNQLRSGHGGFHHCCFLSNVRETANNRGIVHLQNMLLRELRSSVKKILNIDSGIKTIKDIVKSKKVLIVLDDLGQRKQIESLAGDSTWFDSGSRIIITTRDLNCIDKRLKAWDHCMSEMSSHHALQLFCRHAFKMETPPIDHLQVSKEVVAACGGLPLALEVVGSFLRHIDKKYWKSKTDQIIASQDDLQEKLMISYRALDLRTKEIFLDIACFFVGCDRKYAEYMWEACNFRPGRGIDRLSSRSLVKISEDNTFWMHDSIRDLGREIVEQEKLTGPEERSRLWLPSEAEMDNAT